MPTIESQSTAREAAGETTPRRRRGRSASRRRALLDAAQALIREGGPEVSLEQIAARVGVSRPIIYRHFGDRQGLAQAIADDAIGRVLGEGPSTGPGRRVAPWVSGLGVRETIEALVQSTLDFVLADPALFRFIVRERAFRATGPVDDPQAGPLELLSRPLREALEREGVDAPHASLQATAMAGMLTATISAEAEAGAETKSLSRRALEKELVEMALRLCGQNP